MLAPLPKSSSRTIKNWRWNKERELAAKLLAEDELTNAVIAEKAGVTARAMSAWREAPEFQQRIAQHQAEIRRRISRLYNPEKRIQVRARLIDSYVQILDERAALPGYQDPEVVPGGRTGLAVIRPRAVGSGDNQKIIDEVVVDNDTASEIRNQLRELAQEKGEWTEHHDIEVTRFTEIFDALREDPVGPVVEGTVTTSEESTPVIQEACPDSQQSQ